MPKTSTSYATALAVCVACLAASAVGCMDDGAAGGRINALGLTQLEPVAGDKPCAGVCLVTPKPGATYRCPNMQVTETCVHTHEVVCDDGKDEDADGVLDCADKDCFSNPVCGGNDADAGSSDTTSGDTNSGDTNSGDTNGGDTNSGDTNSGDTNSVDGGGGVTPTAAEICDDGVDNDGDGLVDVSDGDCAAKTVATFAICVGAGKVATISVLAGSGQSIEGNYPGAVGTGSCYPFEINGADGFAKVWIYSSWRKFVSDHPMVVWDEGLSVAPSDWPEGSGIPVTSSYQSGSSTPIWVNFFVAGTAN